MMMANSYRQSHTQAGHGIRYDTTLYAPGAFDAEVWKLEQPVLAGILGRHFPGGIPELLDFACGTGRILSFVRSRASRATGVDVSEEMIREARAKVSDAKLILGDVTTNPQLLTNGARFDCVTCFRFFLNAEPALREAGVRAIAGMLKPGGRFVFNNHGNRTSLLRFVIRVRKWLGMETQNALACGELEKLVESYGFRVIETHSVCFMPRSVARIMPHRVWVVLERTLGRVAILRRFGIYQIHVAVRLPVEQAA